MLDNESITKYIQMAKNGDAEAKEIIYKNNLPLLKFLVSKFVDKGVEYDDLLQIAGIGLLKAINNYDSSFGTKFSTYTVPMVIGEIKRYMRDNGSVKVSRAIKQLAAKINKFSDEFFVKEERTPTISEIAEHFKVEEEDIVIALNSTKMPVSIYEQCDDDDGMELIEKISAEGGEEKLITGLQFKEILATLSENERKVIVLRYYKDKTQSEIAKDLGVSQVQVSRIESRVLKKMRQII